MFSVLAAVVLPPPTFDMVVFRLSIGNRLRQVVYLVDLIRSQRLLQCLFLMDQILFVLTETPLMFCSCCDDAIDLLE